MRKYHPDSSQEPGATRRAQEINLAYATLGDPVKRAAYDASRNSKFSSAPPPPPPPPPAPPRGESGTTEGDDKGLDRNGPLLSVSLILIGVLIIGMIVDSSSRLSDNPALEAPIAEETVPAEILPSADIGPPPPGSADGWGEAVVIPTVAVPTEDTGLSSAPTSPVSFDILEAAVRDFDRALASGGINGARTVSRNCYRKLSDLPTWEKVDRCVAFDYAASYFDKSVTSASGGEKREDSYFQFRVSNSDEEYTSRGGSAYHAGIRSNKIKSSIGPIVEDVIVGRINSENSIK